MKNISTRERQVSENLGSAIRYYREKKGYSLQKMFELTGVSPSYLNRLELGQRRNPALSIVNNIADALGVPVDKLVEISLEEQKNTTEELPTIAEIIIYNNFAINGNPVKQEAKEVLVDIVENITDYIWEGKEKNREIYELLDLIEEFKQLA